MMMRILAALFLMAFLCAPAKAQEDFDYTAFASLPVQHEGRIKPVDTLARSMLDLFHGRDSLGSISADAWLAETLFDPAQALQRPLFRVLRPEAVGLPARKAKYYSFAEVSAALQGKAANISALAAKDESTWSEDQRELMRLHELSLLYTQLLRSFTFILPLNIEIPASLAKEIRISPEKPLTLEDYTRHAKTFENAVSQIVRRKGEDPERYTDEERQIADFVFNMEILRQSGDNNILLRILPGQWNNESGEWFSPWAVTQTGQASPETVAYLDHWQAMSTAYMERDAQGWNKASLAALKAAHTFSEPTKIRAEIFYNIWHPVGLSLILYFAAFTGFIVWSLKKNEILRKICLTSLGLGCLSHAAAIVLRVYILERPPVGTLYESILFVALICALAGFFFETRRRDGTGILLGSLCGLLLLFCAKSFAAEDTMNVLVAVLNTNFWLATHVLCITAGYAWCLITALLAHLWLARRAMGRNADEFLAPVKTLALVSLLFTAIGTILGGIWADQSWGRFWGWDPKENGALLIVLWLIWLLHGHIAGQIKRLYFMAGLAMLSCVVAIAWFGVNLLSVGLHSYGFITGVAAGLGAFCAAQTVIVALLFWRIRTAEGNTDGT